MQTETINSTDAATIAIVADAKPVKAKRAPRAAKPVVEAVAVVADAKPVSTYADERHAAMRAVAAFYTSGTSFPFKAASAKLSDLNSANVKAPSVRTAALVAAMLTYAGDNIGPDGTFQRGGFRVPARLINPDAKPGVTLPAMPESGCLGNMLGRVVSHVSGPLGGKQARDGTFRINFDAARAELLMLGDTVAKPALAVLRRIAKTA